VRLLVLLSIAFALALSAAEPIPVLVKTSPKDKGKTYPTLTVVHVQGFTPQNELPKLSTYGGDLSRKTDARGFFYAKKEGERWWLVDPEGYDFIHVAVCSVTPAHGSPKTTEAFTSKFGSEAKWAAATSELLHANGFNGSGAWSNDAVMKAAPQRVVYCPIWNLMSAYGKKRGGTVQKPGHTGYPNDAIFVFDPDFELFAMEHAKQLVATKDDPWLLGHFSDNELPFYRKSLDKFLALEKDDYGYKGAKAWLDQRGGDAKKISDDEREAFLGYIIDRYFSVCAKAIKMHDPNHLYLGSRFHSDEKKIAAAFQAAGKHLDVVSVNLYHQWTPDFEQLANWVKWSGKPFMITEFYAKGEDSGMANTTGAGWLVKTQRERGLFYQNFSMGLLESKGCVGWHYFKYLDNDPENTKVDPSNRDSNKGILTACFEPWTDMLKLMREVNVNVYGLISHTDKGGRIH
jgi:hypothetical protein